MGDGSARRCPDGFLDREEALIEEQILVLQGIGEDGGTESRAGRGRHLSLSVPAPSTPSRAALLFVSLGQYFPQSSLWCTVYSCLLCRQFTASKLPGSRLMNFFSLTDLGVLGQQPSAAWCSMSKDCVCVVFLVLALREGSWLPVEVRIELPLCSLFRLSWRVTRLASPEGSSI